jgi:hypothetical protein
MSTNKLRRRSVGIAAVAVIVAALIVPASALAFEESYGNEFVCGSNCYVQSAGAHTFVYNGVSALKGTAYLACQLFQKEGGVNHVEHGGGFCSVTSGGQYVWARGYNQSGHEEFIGGLAQT